MLPNSWYFCYYLFLKSMDSKYSTNIVVDFHSYYLKKLNPTIMSLHCLFFYFWLCWVFLAVWAVSLVAMQGLLTAVALRCRAGALGAQASDAVVYGLSCSSECGIFHGTRIKPMSPESAGRFSTYWTTREVWYF